MRATDNTVRHTYVGDATMPHVGCVAMEPGSVRHRCVAGTITGSVLSNQLIS